MDTEVSTIVLELVVRTCVYSVEHMFLCHLYYIYIIKILDDIVSKVDKMCDF